MPFLAPAIPAIIGGVGSLLGGLVGNKVGQPSSYQKQPYNLLNFNAQQAGQFGPEFGNTGLNYLRQAGQALAGPQNYFQSILGGNRAEATRALAPDINRIREQNQGILQSASTLAPRGAGRSGALFNLPFQTSSNVSGLYNQMRPMAAQGLTQIGGTLGGLGLGAGGLGANYLNTGNYAAGLMGNLANIFRGQQQQAGGAFGGMLGGPNGVLPGLFQGIGTTMGENAPIGSIWDRIGGLFGGRG